MNITNDNNITFTGRNIEIRKADKIMRQAMNLYPTTSTTKAFNYLTVKKDYDNLRKCSKYFNKLFNLREKRKKLKPIHQIHQAIDDVKTTHNGNCLEMAQIMQAAFLANGYKDVKIGKLNIKEKIAYPNKTKKTRHLLIDHVLLIVNSGKKSKINNLKSYNKHSIIVDPWRGFVDYVHSGLTQYDGVFMDGLRNEKNLLGDMKQRFYFKRYDKIHPTDSTCKTFKEKYPEFIIK